ncbi:MAG TPA: hypothetical protein VM692_13215 [Gammaproteobacteria bacterium]|nr:hypothetical protein [Gammaproteobacteria bacterium]
MADPTENEGALKDAALKDAKNLAAAARDRGMEQLEGAKGQLAEGAERVASAVERTANELDGDGDGAISGYGHSLANLMRQLAGGLRERDIEQFASELGSLARRNPGMFLAGSVALGFGVARFFKARAPQRRADDTYGGYAGGSGGNEWRDRSAQDGYDRGEFDADESLDLSGNPTRVQRPDDDEANGAIGDSSTEQWARTETPASSTQDSSAARGDERQAKSRSGKNKAKTQRASAGANPKPTEGPSSPLGDSSATDGSLTSGDGDSAFTGGTGGGGLRGGKES